MQELGRVAGGADDSTQVALGRDDDDLGPAVLPAPQEARLLRRRRHRHRCAIGGILALR